MSSKLPILYSPTKAQAFSMNMPNLNGIMGTIQGIPTVESNAHSPRNFMIPLQMERIKTDILSLQLAISEMENAYYPHRFRMQQINVDIIRESHVASCIKKLKNLTLLKEFKIGKRGSDGVWIENVENTKLFQKKWFKELVGYILEAPLFGYSLIQLGDLVIKDKEYDFQNLTILKRWNVSPDRKQLVQIPYQTWGLGIEAIKAHDSKNGINFHEDVDANGVKFDDWMIYVDTPSDVGSSICGFGSLYIAAIPAIMLKSNTSFNANFNQMFVAPFRHVKTTERFDSDEYKALERAASNMGAFGYLLTGQDDLVDFLSGNKGNGYQSYGDFEKRLQKSVSKFLLGHADAIDSKATSMGNGAAGKKVVDEDSSAEGKALAETEKNQDEFCLNALNSAVYGKFKNLGFPLVDGESFYLPNDKEDYNVKQKQIAQAGELAAVAKDMKSAGLQMDAKYFEENTGVTTTEVPTPPAPQPFGKAIAKKLNRIYGTAKLH